jgi:hypothetical protein
VDNALQLVGETGELLVDSAKAALRGGSTTLTKAGNWGEATVRAFEEVAEQCFLEEDGTLREDINIPGLFAWSINLPERAVGTVQTLERVTRELPGSVWNMVDTIIPFGNGIKDSAGFVLDGTSKLVGTFSMPVLNLVATPLVYAEKTLVGVFGTEKSEKMKEWGLCYRPLWKRICPFP